MAQHEFDETLSHHETHVRPCNMALKYTAAREMLIQGGMIYSLVQDITTQCLPTTIGETLAVGVEHCDAKFCGNLRPLLPLLFRYRNPRRKLILRRTIPSQFISAEGQNYPTMERNG